ncbi:MAG: hypothetical protein FWG85_04205 [Bacteroidetes bacterium]|nr:hypothetical protein [Bacteroidota bacterium]
MEVLELEIPRINEINEKYSYPNEETIQAIREVENGEVIEIGTFEDYLIWMESV